MKKLVSILAVAGMIVAATTAFAGRQAATGVNGSFHDINTVGGYQADDFKRVCIYCHTPHNADTTSGDLNPLWNHTLPSGTWQAYQWATPLNQDVSMTITDPLMGPTRICMSCHDGATAVDQHGPTAAGSLAHPQAGTTAMSGARAVGLLRGGAGTSGDLTDDHPVGFNYLNAATVRNVDPLKPEIVDPTQKFATAVSTTTFDANGYNDVTRAGTKTIGEVLYQGNIMTCASCHEVHNYRNVVMTAADVQAGVTPPNFFLYAKETDSLICLSCHYK